MPKITEEEYTTYVQKCWQQHEDAMHEAHETWKELWQLYQNKQDWSNKQGWQAKTFIPKIMMQVEKSSGQVKRAVLQTRKLFKFELDDSAEQEQIQQLQESMVGQEDPNQMAAIQQEIATIKRQLKVRISRMQMREKQFKQKLMDSDFASVYSEMMKPCILLGIGIPKVLWSDGLKFEHVDAFNFAVSPDFKPYQKNRAPFMIERQEMDLAEFRQRVKKAPKTWITKAVNKVEADVQKLDRFSQQRTRKGFSDYSDVNKRIELKLFWGDVVGKDDKTIEENMLLVVANGSHLVRKFKNPFSHGKYPYPLTIPMVYPHRGTHGTSLIAPQVKMQYTVNNIVNMVMDNLNFTINKIYEYNPNDLLNPNAINTIYPGKMVPVNTQPGQQAIREVVTSAMKRDSLYFYELIDREMQEGSSVTEYISGLPGKKSKTLGEVELKTAQSQGLFDTIARDLEMNSLKPLLEMAYDLHVQFDGWEEREGNYIFVVSGLTVMLMQRELVEKLSQILGMALQSPVLGQMTEIGDLWKKLLDTYNLSHVYKDPQSQGIQLDPRQIMNIEGQASNQARSDMQNVSDDEKVGMLEGMVNQEQPTGAKA